MLLKPLHVPFSIADFSILTKTINLDSQFKSPLYIIGYNLNKNMTYRKTLLKEKINANEKQEPDFENNNKNLKSKKNLFSFWEEILEEAKMVEWPTIDRLFKQFVIVVISLVISAFIIYSVDGLFAWGSKLLFEGKY